MGTTKKGTVRDGLRLIFVPRIRHSKTGQMLEAAHEGRMEMLYTIGGRPGVV